MDEPVAKDPGLTKDVGASASGSGGPGGSGTGKPPKAKRAPLTAIACVACRKRKSRCDGARPLCDTCNQKGTPCFYDMDIGDRSQIQLRAKIDVVTSDRENFRDLLFWFSDIFAPDIATTIKNLVGLDDGLPRDQVARIKDLILQTYPYLLIHQQQHQQHQQQQQQQQEQQRTQQIGPSSRQTSFSSYPPNTQWQYGSYQGMPYPPPQTGPVSSMYYQTPSILEPPNEGAPTTTYQPMMPQNYMPTQVPLGPFVLPNPQHYTSVYPQDQGPPQSQSTGMMYSQEHGQTSQQEGQHGQQGSQPDGPVGERND